MYTNKEEMTVYSFDAGEIIEFEKGAEMVPYNLSEDLKSEAYNFVRLKIAKSMVSIKDLSEDQFEELCRNSSVYHEFLPKFEIPNRTLMLARNKKIKGIVVWVDGSLITSI
jgi:hypothetical protein